MPIDPDDPAMDGYIPLDTFRDMDDPFSSRRIREDGDVTPLSESEIKALVDDKLTVVNTSLASKANQSTVAALQEQVNNIDVLADGNKGDINVAGNNWTIRAKRIVDAMMRDSLALSILGRASNSDGTPTDIQALNDGDVLRRSGTALGFGKLAGISLEDESITEGKLGDAAVSHRALALAAVHLENIDFSGMRIPAQADVNLYVSALGNDDNPGTITSHLATPGAAWRILRDKYDGRGFTATIWIVGLNNYPVDVIGPAFGFSKVYIQGYGVDLNDVATWGTVGFNPALATAAIKIGQDAKAYVRGLSVGSNNGHGIMAWWSGSVVEYSSIRFLQCQASGGAQAWATQGGQMESYGVNTVFGGAGSHIQASHGGRFRNTSAVTYLQANVSYFIGTAYALNGEIVLTGSKPVGGAYNPAGFTATGRQWFREGDGAAIQSYGLQTPAPGDFFGSLAGAHGSNT